MELEDSTIREFHREPDWWCGVWRRLFIQVWNGATTGDRAQLVCDAMARFARDQPRGFATLIVLGPTATLPDAGARAVFATEARKIERRLHGVAYLTAFSGFKGAAMRSVMTALSMVAREAFPWKVFDDRHDAARWLADLLADNPAGTLLLTADIERLMARVTPTP